MDYTNKTNNIPDTTINKNEASKKVRRYLSVS